MISVVLIDDEYFFRQSLKKNIPWRDLGFHIIGEASNGREGCELIVSLRPDVVFLDINMPVMDGFDLCEALCNLDIFPKIIFLTGYEEFSYAKLAIQYGAKNYLLKPINPQEVEAALRKLANDYFSNDHYREQDRLQNPQYLIALRQEYLLELLMGKLHKGVSVRDIASFLNLNCDAAHYCAVTIRLEHPVTPGNSIASQFLASITSANDIFGDYNHCFGLSENLIAGLIAMENEDIDPLHVIAGRFIEQMNASLFSNVTIAIGSLQNSLSDVPVSYADSIDTLCNRLLIGDNQILDYQTIYTYVNCENVITPQIKEHMQHTLIYFDIRTFSEIVQRVFSIFKNCSCTFRCVQASCSSIIALVAGT